MLDWLFGRKYDEYGNPILRSNEVIWYYRNHADGSQIRHMGSGPTQIWNGSRWVKADGCSMGEHPNGVPSVGYCETAPDLRPDYIHESYH
jgi:hypothetical protein